jgi:hypothetical protein
MGLDQGCQMFYLHNKNPNLGIFFSHLLYFVAIMYTYFVVIWYLIFHFGMFYQEKYGWLGPG